MSEKLESIAKSLTIRAEKEAPWL
uniref:Uncharacterized protein n=1 Tax=Arundo donax TaxID=35708 RepID=A0A0A9HDE3_ARUDO